MKKQQKSVLIVEDNAFLAKTMQKVLSAHDIRVSVARNTDEALKSIAENSPQLLLLDLLLPHVDGYVVLQYRKNKKLTFPVIVCSNLSDKANRSRCKAFGVSAFVVKSDIDDQQLWPVVEKYLQ